MSTLPPPPPPPRPASAPGTTPPPPPVGSAAGTNVSPGATNLNPTPAPPAATQSQPAPSNIPAAPVGPKSCRDCVFYVDSTDDVGQDLMTNRSATGASICANKKIVLATMNTPDTDKALSITATECTRFERIGHAASQNRNTDPATYWMNTVAGHGLSVLEPIEFGFDKSGTPTSDAEKPISCQRCVFFADAGAMAAEGIVSNGCSKRSIMIPNGKAAEIANECNYGSDDKSTSQPVEFHSIDMFAILVQDDYQEPDDDDDDDTNTKTGKPRAKKAPAMEPASAEDQANGIEGWLKIVDKTNKERFVLLPVFDITQFSPEERAKIPMPGDDEHPELYQDHQNLAYKMGVIWRKLNETPALTGKAGVGKTECGRYLAMLMHLPFERISITNSSEIDELAGRTVLIKDGDVNKTEFQYGRIPKAWGKPCVMVIDEPNVGPTDVWQFFRPMTDNSKQLVLDMNKGERIARNEFCFMFMAMNPAWDMLNVGTHEISDADGRRLMHIQIPEPEEKLERKIVTQRVAIDGYTLSDETLDSIMKIAKDLRELCRVGQLPMQWGVAQQIKVARASQWFDLRECYRLAIADLLAPEDSEKILQVVKTNAAAGPARRGPGRPRKNF